MKKMAENFVPLRPWAYYEEDFPLHWFHSIAANNEPEGTISVLAEVARFQSLAGFYYPELANPTQADIVWKLLEFKYDFENFRSFLYLRGLHFDEDNDVREAGLDFYVMFAYAPNELYNSVHYRGVRNCTLLRYLFHNGWLNRVDYRWLVAAMTGADILWLGEPYV